MPEPFSWRPEQDFIGKLGHVEFCLHAAQINLYGAEIASPEKRVLVLVGEMRDGELNYSFSGTLATNSIWSEAVAPFLDENRIEGFC